MEKEKTFWGIHAGKTGDAETLFESKSVVAIGWEQMGDLSGLKTRDDFKQRYEKVFAGVKPGAIRINAGQLYRFVREMKLADSVIFPLKGALKFGLVALLENTDTIHRRVILTNVASSG